MTPELAAVVEAARALLRVDDLHLDNRGERVELVRALLEWEKTL